MDEEMALVQSKIDELVPFDVIRNRDGRYSYIYREFASDGYPLELVYFGDNINDAIIQSIYPLNFHQL